MIKIPELILSNPHLLEGYQSGRRAFEAGQSISTVEVGSIAMAGWLDALADKLDSIPVTPRAPFVREGFR